jgi:hypothetical protein
MKVTITIEPEDIRNYDIAVDWSDTQVSNFIERWQQSMTDALTDTLAGPRGLLDDYMNDPKCTYWVAD